MRTLTTLLFAFIFVAGISQNNISLLENENLQAVNVEFSKEKYNGIDALKVMPKQTETEAKFVKLSDVSFTNGTIMVDVAGKRAKSAGRNARGFVGVVFRVDQDNSGFELFYIRPTNGRAEDQLRRNHSVQYTSFPDYPWHKLRKETPGKYETYADLVEGEWTKLKIEVKGDKARLYVGDAAQPTLLVNDLKLGTGQEGAIGLWVGPGTEAYFANLTVED